MKFIGIDPDVERCGVGVYDAETGELEPMTMEFFDLLDFLKKNREEIFVIIEAGWLNKKSNFHGFGGARGERIAKNVGANHQIGKLIAEFCRRENINYKLFQPRKKKTDPVQFNKITGYTVKNQDVIDACMLVWGRKNESEFYVG